MLFLEVPFYKAYAIKDLFGIIEIVSANIINPVIVVNI